MKKYSIGIVLVLLIVLLSGCNEKITISLHIRDEVNKITVSKNTPIAEIGFTNNDYSLFLGWYDNDEFNGKKLPADFKLKKDVSLYAKILEYFEYELQDDGTYAIIKLNLPLKEIIVPNRFNGKPVTKLCDNLFLNQTRIEKISIEEGILKLGNNVFNGCTNLTKLDIPKSIQSIGDYCFTDCNKLSFEDEDGLMYLNDILISSTEDRTSYIIRDNTKIICSFSFKNITIPFTLQLNDELIYISQNAFSQSNVEVINIGSNVCDIPSNALYSTEFLKELNVSKNNQFYESFDGCLYSKGKKDLIKYPQQKNTYIFNLPEDVQTIMPYAFENSKLEKIFCKNNLETISEGAFINCKYLTYIDLGSNIKAILKSAFNGCEKLEIINLGEKLEEIGSFAFARCKNIKNINFPSSLDTIGEKAFYFCISLERVELENISELGDYAFANCTKLKRFFINSKNTIFGKLVLSNTSLEELVIPFVNINFLTEISEENNLAFLQILEITSITRLVDKFFEHSPNLIKLILPENLDIIDQYVFSDLLALSILSIDNESKNYITIDNCLFDHNISKMYYYASGKKDLSYTILESVTEIVTGCFANNILQSISLPKNLESIMTSSFYNMSSLKNLTIPKNVSIIENSAFINCKDLKIQLEVSSVPITWSTNWNNGHDYYLKSN